MTLAPDFVVCHWVPGTLDRVRVVTPHREDILDIREVAQRFGRQALDALYLKGRYTTREAH